jgi:hypothetical protein
MAQMSPQASKLLEKALSPSAHDRSLIIEGPAEEGVEVAWDEEIKRRVEEIQSGKIEMIPGEEVDRRVAARLSNVKK